MRCSFLILFSVLVLPAAAIAQGRPQTVITTPGYSSPYSPYPPTYQGVPMIPGVPGASPYTGGVAAGAFPPGARTCVAADQVCRASAPNTVGNPCTCPGRDGQPVPGSVH